jgi:two-component system, NarL family, nitrate/nitrite response regulator NarL
MKFISDENLCKVGNLLVASACKVKSARYREELTSVARLFHVNNFDLLKDELVQLEPEMLLLDYDLPRLNGVLGVSELRRLCPRTNIVVFHDSASDEEEWAMFKAGVRGFCPTDIEPSSLKMVVVAVSNGELWIRRKFLRRLLEQLEEKQGKEQAKYIEFHSDVHGLLDQLTHREYEIAVRVGSGESNKQIAYSLEITERTVKAHLTSIFEKLGVTDRLNVALIVSAEKHQERSVQKVSKGISPVHLSTIFVQT